MSFIPTITCRRCGRQYSGIRSRCPYCGTRRVSASERVPSAAPGVEAGQSAPQRGASNAKWQLIFGAILMAAVILAVIVLVSTSLNGAVKQTPTPTLPPVTATPIATPTPTPTPPPTPTITSVNIYYYTEATTDFTTTVGWTTQLSAAAYPLDVDTEGHFVWTSSDDNVATVVDGLVTGVGAGTATITVECYGVTQTCTVRVKDA